MKTRLIVGTCLVLLITFSLNVTAHEAAPGQGAKSTADVKKDETRRSEPVVPEQMIPEQMVKVAQGTKKKVRGMILRRDTDTFTLRDTTGGDLVIKLVGTTKVEEKKSNIFRQARNFGTTSLVRGLSIEVEGRGDASGALVAEKIRFTENALITAQAVETRVTPVEGRIGETENRLGQAEANAQRMAGQIDELNALSNQASTLAKNSQASAERALAGVEAANKRVDATNNRIDNLVSTLDDYEPKRGVTINFRVGSARLLADSMAMLDEIASQAKNERAYLIEITGFASADGKADLNRKLSQQRADAVVRYLAEKHMIPLRRMVTPFGYGAAQPVADNTTRQGREQNRRVEVKILVNKALSSPTPAARNSR